MTTLNELAAMLDAATRPSREIDVAAFQALFPDTRVYEAHCPPLTSSIDAALALVERLLPGAITVHAQQWKHPTYERPESWTWELSNYPRGRTTATYSPTAPLAILKALVAALIAQEKTND